MYIHRERLELEPCLVVRLRKKVGVTKVLLPKTRNALCFKYQLLFLESPLKYILSDRCLEYNVTCRI